MLCVYGNVDRPNVKTQHYINLLTPLIVGRKGKGAVTLIPREMAQPEQPKGAGELVPVGPNIWIVKKLFALGKGETSGLTEELLKKRLLEGYANKSWVTEEDEESTPSQIQEEKKECGSYPQRRECRSASGYDYDSDPLLGYQESLASLLCCL
eukprot:gb/GECG01001166.1/.p1 GENE.gb/GECG01001166.1/~~gb/GECG01001166.1/.p1  ORF type:complete len:153 (+),score=18.52 gb/GECG01001166.1/:1-459(+)